MHRSCRTRMVSARSQVLPPFPFALCYTQGEFEEVRLLENISIRRLLPA